MSKRTSVISEEVTKSQKNLSPLIWELCDIIVAVSAKHIDEQFSKDLQKDLIVAVLEGSKLKKAAKDQKPFIDWHQKFKSAVDTVVTFDELKYSFDYDFLLPKITALEQATLALLKQSIKVPAAHDGMKKFFEYIKNAKLWDKLYNDKDWIQFSVDMAKIITKMGKENLL